MKALTRLYQFNASFSDKPLIDTLQGFASVISGLHRSESIEINEQIAGKFADAISTVISTLERAYEDLTDHPVETMRQILPKGKFKDESNLTPSEEDDAKCDLPDLTAPHEEETSLVPELAPVSSHSDVVVYDSSPSTGLQSLPSAISVATPIGDIESSALPDTINLSGLVEGIGAYSHFGAYANEFNNNNNADTMDQEPLPSYKLKLHPDHIDRFCELLELSDKRKGAYNSHSGYCIWQEIVASALKRFELKTGKTLTRNKMLLATSMLTPYFVQKVCRLFTDDPDAYSYENFFGVLAELPRLSHEGVFTSAIHAQLKKIVYACLHTRFDNLEVTDWMDLLI